MEISILNEGKKLIRSSIDSVSELTLFKNLRIATALLPDWTTFRNLRIQGLFYNKIDFDGVNCCIIYKGLDFEAKPQSSKSEGSDAIYIARKDNGVNSSLLQYMPPHSVTSRHFHRITTERFHNLEGSCSIEVDNTPYQLSRNTLQVNPGKTHQVRTQESPSLTLIEMLGNPKGLSMNDHHYL